MDVWQSAVASVHCFPACPDVVAHSRWLTEAQAAGQPSFAASLAADNTGYKAHAVPAMHATSGTAEQDWLVSA